MMLDLLISAPNVTMDELLLACAAGNVEVNERDVELGQHRDFHWSSKEFRA